MEGARQVLGSAGKSFQLLLARLIRIGCVLVALIGFEVLCGWIFNIPWLTDVRPGLSFMKINVAWAVIVASIAVWLLHTQPQGSAWFRVARCLALLVVALGALTMFEHLFGLTLGIDIPFPLEAQSAHPGRMALATSFNLVLVGLALLTLKARRPNLAACAHWLVVPPLLVSALAVLGYAYGAASLYAWRPYGVTAVHTAVSFVVLILCVLAADSAHGFTSIAISDTSGGIVTRRLLPTIPITIFVLGLVRMKGQELGLYDAPFGSALMVLMSTAFCVIAVAWTATTLHKVDLVRKLIETENLSLNAGLESRVRERTQELAQVSAQLRLVNGTLELLSNQDGLTGLANRRRFDAHLGAQISIARRYGRSLALVLCDVDSFKAYNPIRRRRVRLDPPGDRVGRCGANRPTRQRRGRAVGNRTWEVAYGASCDYKRRHCRPASQQQRGAIDRGSRSMSLSSETLGAQSHDCRASRARAGDRMRHAARAGRIRVLLLRYGLGVVAAGGARPGSSVLNMLIRA